MTREEQKKKFDHQRLALSDRIRRDDRLKSSVVRVGAELTSKLSYTTGLAKADQDWLAKELGLSLRTVKTAIKVLQAAGHFEVIKRGRTNLYKPVFDPEKVQNLHQSEDEQVQNLHLSEDDGCKKRPQQVQKTPPKKVQNLPHSISFKRSLSLPFPDPAVEAASAPEGAGGSPSLKLDHLVARLERRLGNAVFGSWFGKNLIGATLAPDVLTLRFPNQFHADRVKRDYETTVLECAQADHPDLQRVIFTVANSAAAVKRQHPDASWLDEVGVGLVGDAMGFLPEKAGKTIKEWLRRCGYDATGLRAIIAEAAEGQLIGDQFSDVVKQATKALFHANQTALEFMRKPEAVRKAS